MHKKVCSKGLNKVSLLERWHLTEQRFKGPGKGAMELAGESSGPRELVCECTRALAGLSEGRARVPEDVWPVLWVWVLSGAGIHTCYGCEGVGKVAEVHTNSWHNLFQARCRALVCAHIISRFIPVTTPENGITFPDQSGDQSCPRGSDSGCCIPPHAL